ncbi:MAG: 2-oxoisovalerate dehydrogenase E1 component alpha subunit [Candidatus Endobugula sp.]|jgi:2-oxoisovalerate dehydrogenase E1 component alpha subunit
MKQTLLSLRVPEPLTRPGDTPDFSYLQIPTAGNDKKPAHNASISEFNDLSKGIIRVLDDTGHPKGEWQPTVSADTLITGLTAMVKTRAYDDRMMLIQRQGKTSFFMKSTGEEAISVAQTMVLKQGDMFFPTYRQAGLLITNEMIRGTGWSTFDMMCQVLSNSGDKLKGRQLPVMYSSKGAGFFSISGNLGTQYTQAVGWAMASAIKNDSKIASAFIGDGSTAESDFHAALTFASVYKPPIILNVTNNQWAISSFQGIANNPETTFAARGIGYGIPSLRVDGNDFLAVYAVSEWAADRARNNLGPTIIEWVTYRSSGHSSSDDPSKYRPKDEEKAWPLGDPIDRLKQHLIHLGEWSEKQHLALEKEMKEEIIALSKEAQKLGSLTDLPDLPMKCMFDDVYKDIPPHLQKQIERIERGE